MFEYIPEELRPTYEQHCDYDNVYRLVISTDNLSYKDFVPSYLEEGFIPKHNQGDYSVSLYKSKKVLIKLREKINSLWKYDAIAIGSTSITRGVSFGEMHIHYFLFDYVNNSPCDDFTICEVI